MNLVEIFKFGDDIYGNSVLNIDSSNANVVAAVSKKEIHLRDYQNDAYSCILNDLQYYRSSLCVLATGLGKTVLFSKIIDNWPDRVLVLVHLEELLQNAYTEISEITGEIIGVERGKDHEEGERVVCATVQSISLRLSKFNPNHFSLIIVDEAHHSASNIYKRVLDYFSSSKVIGLTATDRRSDGKRLPFDVCSYRLGIAEGIKQGYLVPIKGNRIIIDSIDLSRVKRKADESDFDDSALDDEMVKGAAAIADVIYNSHCFDKGILFFPGCASAKLTNDFLNKKSEGLSVYIDGTITGEKRRDLVGQLRSGTSNWLCNVGIATEGFNWPEATVVGMCAPTMSRSAYVQRAGRGTRPESGILNGILSRELRVSAILNSSKPYMTILDFVGVSANITLIDHESFLDDQEKQREEKKEQDEQGIEREKEEDSGDEQGEGSEEESTIFFARPGFVSRVQSRTLHSTEEFDPINELSDSDGGVNLKTGFDPGLMISDPQMKLIKKYGIEDPFLTKKQAQKLVGFIAQHGFRLTNVQRNVLKKLYTEILNDGT